MNGIGHHEGPQHERLLDLLLSQEMAERTEAFEAAVDLLRSLMNRWSG
ncbi:hypothetical protein ACIP10_26700 [Streptomyces galbus]